MTHSQLTQCPHCKASFKVSEEQLNAANGRVRCGACLNIFDAIAYRISSQIPQKQDNKNLQEELNESLLEEDFSFNLDDAVDLENELLDIESKQDNKDDDLSVFADDPEEDKLEKGYSGTTKLDDELSSSFLELDKSRNDNFKTQFLKDDSSDDISESIDESWTASILDDLEEPESNRKEPNFSTSDPSDTDKSEIPETETPTFSPTSGLENFTQKDLNSLNFEYEQDSTTKSKWIVSTCLFILNFCLILLLLAQASWFHYEKLVKYPKIAELYGLACQQLGCVLPTLSDISKIENRNLVVRSHPTTFNALIIETIITNHAGFDQAFPDISLSFSNINNQIIAQRLFTPSEYLNAETLKWPGMTSEQPIQITLEIIDPGAEAVNYKINFHSPQASPIDQQADQMSTNQSKI